VTRVLDVARRVARPLRRRLRPTASERRLAELGIRPGDLALDCGANVGTVTEALTRLGAEVHAFEPNPHAYEELERRVGSLPNVHLHPVAVLDRDEGVRLYFHRNSASDEVAWSVGSSLVPTKGNVDPDRYIEVRGIDLGRFVLDLECSVKVAKIDVEGVEHIVLHRLIDSGAIDRIETVLVEVHDAHMPMLREDTRRLVERLRAEGLERKVRLDWS
jgi:FkbM family methyltransferase